MPAPKRIQHVGFPPRNLAQLSQLGRKALLLWSADYDGDVTGAHPHTLTGGATRNAHSIKCDGVDDYVAVGTVTDDRLSGAASVTVFVDLIINEFDFDAAAGWQKHILDNAGGGTARIFNLMGEDNAVSVGFWGCRIITPKGDIQAGDRIRVAYKITDGNTSSTVIYINGVRRPWTVEGGSHQIQNFLSTWKVALNAQEESSAPGTYTNFSANEVFSAAIIPEALPDDEMQALTADPVNALFEPRRIWIPTVIQGGADLQIADTEATPVTDASSITQTHVLTGSDAEAAAAVDAVAVTQVHGIVAADTEATPQTEAPAVGQAHELGISGAEAQSTVDGVAVSQQHQVAVADTDATPTIDAPSIDGGVTLTVADVEAPPAVDVVAVSQTHALGISGAESVAELDVVAITQTHEAVAADAEAQASLDALAIVQEHAIAVTDTQASPELDAVAVDQTHALFAAALIAEAGITDVPITQEHRISPDVAEATPIIDTPALIDQVLGDIQDPSLRSSTPYRSMMSATPNRAVVRRTPHRSIKFH